MSQTRAKRTTPKTTRRASPTRRAPRPVPTLAPARPQRPLATVKRQVSLQSLSVEGLEAMLQVLRAPGSLTMSIAVGVQLGGKVLSVSGDLSLSGSLTMEDDRRFRASATVGFGASITADFVVWAAKVGITRSYTLTGVYQDEAHFAAVICARIVALVRAIKRYLLIRARSKGLTPAQARNLLRGSSTRALKRPLGTIAPGRVTGRSTSKTFELSTAQGQKLAVTSTDRTSTFHRTDPGNPAQRQAHLGKSQQKHVHLNLGTVALDVTWTKIERHAVPDNDGTYLNIKLSGSRSTSFITTGVANSIASRLLKLTIGATDIQGVVGELKSKVRSIVKAVKKAPTKEQSALSVGVEANFIRTGGGWAAQYARVFTGMKRSQETTIPIIGPLMGKLEGSLEYQTTLAEIAGSGTLSYFQTVYNGFMNRDARTRAAKKAGRGAPRGVAQWRAYVARQKGALWRALRAVCTPGTAPQKEATAGVRAACLQHKSALQGKPSSTLLFGQLLPVVEAAFAKNDRQAKTKLVWFNPLGGGTAGLLGGHYLKKREGQLARVSAAKQQAFKGWVQAYASFVGKHQSLVDTLVARLRKPHAFFAHPKVMGMSSSFMGRTTTSYYNIDLWQMYLWQELGKIHPYLRIKYFTEFDITAAGQDPFAAFKRKIHHRLSQAAPFEQTCDAALAAFDPATLGRQAGKFNGFDGHAAANKMANPLWRLIGQVHLSQSDIRGMKLNIPHRVRR